MLWYSFMFFNSRGHRKPARESTLAVTSCVNTPTQEDEEQNDQMQAMRQLYCCQRCWMWGGIKFKRRKNCRRTWLVAILSLMCSGLLLLQCGLALHRKCMESCQLECENRKGTVFGVDLSVIPRDKQDEVPFVVLQCTAEIEHRALSVQVRFIITRDEMVVKISI